MADLREASRKDWGGNNTVADINAGSLQRIADATELMAKRYTELIDERDRLKRWADEARDRAYRVERSNAALRGVVTRLKKRIAALEVEDGE